MCQEGDSMIRDYFYTLTEAASVLAMNRLTIRRWLDAGKLTGEHIGATVLIPRWEIEAIAAMKRIGGKNNG